MKKLAVVDKFFEEHHLQQIGEAAEKHGYAVDCYPDGVLPQERAGEYEIVYGMPDKAILRDMKQLKWFCASFAGVDRYVDEALYPHEGVLLTNSARDLGFDGKTCVHPRQIDAVNACFTPSAKEIRNAERLLAALDEAAKNHTGVCTLDGSMVDKPMELRARTTLAKAAAAGIKIGGVQA